MKNSFHSVCGKAQAMSTFLSTKVISVSTGRRGNVCLLVFYFISFRRDFDFFRCRSPEQATRRQQGCHGYASFWSNQTAGTYSIQDRNTWPWTYIHTHTHTHTCNSIFAFQAGVGSLLYVCSSSPIIEVCFLTEDHSIVYIVSR